MSPTDALAHRTSRDHLTALAADPAAGLPTVTSGQVARGKATPPQATSTSATALLPAA